VKLVGFIDFQTSENAQFGGKLTISHIYFKQMDVQIYECTKLVQGCQNWQQCQQKLNYQQAYMLATIWLQEK